MYRIRCVLLPTSDKSKNYKPAPQHKKRRRRSKKKSSRIEGCQVSILCRSLPISSIHKTTGKKSEMMRTRQPQKPFVKLLKGKNKWIASKFQLHAVEKSRIKETKCRGTDHDTSAFFPQFFSFQNIKKFSFSKKQNKTNRIVKLFFCYLFDVWLWNHWEIQSR